MASLSLLFLIIVSITALCQGRYHYQQQQLQPQDELSNYNYNYNINPNARTHSSFRGGNDLGPLNEDELETLLFLLEKTKGNNDGGYNRVRNGGGGDTASDIGKYYEEPIALNLDSSPARKYYYETRNKRVGHPQKKNNINWDDYFGIDKKKRSPTPQRTGSGMRFLNAAPFPSVLTTNPLTHQQQEKQQTTIPAGSSLSPQEEEQQQHHVQSHDEEITQEDKQAEEEKKEEKLKDFYRDMALATNMRRRKRSGGAHNIKNIRAPAPMRLESKESTTIATTTTAILSTSTSMKNEQQELINKELASKMDQIASTTKIPSSTAIPTLLMETTIKGQTTTSPKTTTTIKPSTTNNQDVENNVPKTTNSDTVVANAPTEFENVISPTATTTAPAPSTSSSSTTKSLTRIQLSSGNGNDMSRGDLEKLKARLIKQISAAYSLDQLRQLLHETLVK